MTNPTEAQVGSMVYLVLVCIDYEGDSVEGVFADEAQARKFRDTIAKEWDSPIGRGVDVEVVPWNVGTVRNPHEGWEVNKGPGGSGRI